MIKLSKTLLFILIILMPILGIISYKMIDWDVFNSGIKGAIKEIILTLVFFGLGISFIFQYVSRLRENK